MEIIGSIIKVIATAIGNSLWVPIQSRIGYVLDSTDTVENLRNKVEKLRPMKDDVERSVKLARERGEVIKSVVKEWQTSVDGIEVELRRLDDEENITCLSWCCPSLRVRYRLGEKATKLMLDLDALQKEGKFSVVSDPAAHSSIEYIPTGDSVDFGSTKSAMNQVIDALTDEKIKVVGVYGLGGVGKTTLMEEVAKQMKKENRYNEVVKVTISQNPDLKRIQNEFAEKLGLKFEENSSKEARAARLWARLKEERVLLILDDLWDQLELPEIGIPCGSEHKGCEIVVTSRNLHVCEAMMSQVKIYIPVLSDDDSWFLFKKYAGDFIESPGFYTVAKDVVRECGGLPLAIITLGRALREKDVSYWKNILVDLKRSIPTNVLGMDTKVFKPLMVSYNALESEEIKSCFLFCCLFPEDYDIEIEELMQYGIGEGLYKGVLTLNEARGRVGVLVDNLKARCLLLEGGGKGTVKMHDIIRDLAIKISSENKQKVLVKARLGLKRWPELEEVDKCYKISLMHNQISILPDRPECPKLRTLLFTRNYSLKEIPNNFFQGMTGLVVLDLTYTNISLLPSSFSCLTNLRTLLLRGHPKIINWSLLGELKKLEILILKSVEIDELPEEIGELTNLKLLSLQDTFLARVPPNVISRLTSLEELDAYRGFGKWELLGKGPGRNASFAEVALLPNLTVLAIVIDDVEILSQEVFGAFRNLREFDIVVGRLIEEWLEPVQGRRCMDLRVSGPLANWVKELAERTEVLSLSVKTSFENVKPLLTSLPCLTALYIDTEDWEILSQDIFGPWRNLSNFYIQVSERYTIEAIRRSLMVRSTRCMDLHVSGPLANWVKELAERTEALSLTVHTSFENVVPLINRNPSSLKNLSFYVDEEREHLIRVEDVSENAFGSLESLELDIKGHVKKLCEGPIPSGFFGNLRTLAVYECKNLRYLLSFVPEDISQQLECLSIVCSKKIEGLIPREEEESAVMEGIASPILSESRTRISLLTFQNLRKLSIWSCPSFKYIFSWKLANGLNQLEELELWQCDGMEVIIAEEEDEVGMVDSRVLPKLKTLELRNLKILVSFFQGEERLDMASLEVIVVAGCENLKRLPLGPQSAPNLKKIQAEREWFEELEWRDGSITKSRLQPLLEERPRWKVPFYEAEKSAVETDQTPVDEADIFKS